MIAIFQREFFGILRLRRAVVAMVAMAVCSGLLVLARWPSEALVDLSGSQARQVFRIFTYGMLAGVLLLAPAWPATSFVQERRRGTLALLFNTPLSKLAIYAGKLSGVLAFVGLVLITSLPAAAACYAMGGIRRTGQRRLPGVDGVEFGHARVSARQPRGDCWGDDRNPRAAALRHLRPITLAGPDY
ncbi:hypothetical protein EBU58_05925 [bacterium]|nr:hypothetical protein [bacterium]